MNRALLWKLCGTISVGTVVLFWLINILSQRTELAMSTIAKHHQQTLIDYGREAEALYLAGDELALKSWMDELQAREQTWAAVVRSDIRPLAGGKILDRFVRDFRLGRNVVWKIHLYFPENPVMDITFRDKKTHFLITLPQRMRPGNYWLYTSVLLQVALPLILLIILSLVLYRHVMQPLRQLETATRQFSEGDYDVRVRNCIGDRQDEITSLADTFDDMAQRTGQLIITQRQLIADLSHELRTPITRIEMAISCAEQGIKLDEVLPRVQRETTNIRRLAEDTLTLAWLENEQPKLMLESLDLVELVQVIIDDAAFEYPDRKIVSRLPEQALLAASSLRALGQAIENVIRNALRFTPAAGRVDVTLCQSGEELLLSIEDEGPGVPEALLKDIFYPFFRVDKSRERTPGSFGLGLALARRQIEATGGSIRASNLVRGGLVVQIKLPLQNKQM